MASVVTVRDASGGQAVAFTLDEAWAQRPAVDFVLDVVGAPVGELPPGASISPEQGFALKQLQQQIFDHDDQGAFIRDGVGFTANGRDLDPDAPLSACFMPAINGGQRGSVCEIRIETPNPDAASPMEVFGRMALLYFLANGQPLDVTKDYYDLAPVLEAVERDGLVDIDVQRASYRLTPKGEALHRDWMREAQDLVKRYDIYGDVDEDPSGEVRFDTGLGQDLRVAMFEHEGRDPFRSRFLLGLNDGEWEHLANWPERIMDARWYDEIFGPIESSPGAADIGATRLDRIAAAGKRALRADGAFERPF